MFQCNHTHIYLTSTSIFKNIYTSIKKYFIEDFGLEQVLHLQQAKHALKNFQINSVEYLTFETQLDMLLKDAMRKPRLEIPNICVGTKNFDYVRYIIAQRMKP